jgi:hypothetical protein
MQSDEQIRARLAKLDAFEEARREILAGMTQEEIEEEGRMMDEILQRIEHDWDMSAVPFSFYLQEKAEIRSERIAADRETLRRMLEGDPEEHRATWEALRAALEARYRRSDDARASG